MSELQISVVASDEVRVTGGTAGTPAMQKLVSPMPNADPALYWSPAWIRELVSYLTTNKYLQNRYPKYINFLIWHAYRLPSLPDHAQLVDALQLLLGAWMSDCANDNTCLAPPSRRMLQDREIAKILVSYDKMKTAIKTAQADPADADAVKAALGAIEI